MDTRKPVIVDQTTLDWEPPPGATPRSLPGARYAGRRTARSSKSIRGRAPDFASRLASVPPHARWLRRRSARPARDASPRAGHHPDAPACGWPVPSRAPRRGRPARRCRARARGAGRGPPGVESSSGFRCKGAPRRIPTWYGRSGIEPQSTRVHERACERNRRTGGAPTALEEADRGGAGPRGPEPGRGRPAPARTGSSGAGRRTMGTPTPAMTKQRSRRGAGMTGTGVGDPDPSRIPPAWSKVPREKQHPEGLLRPRLHCHVAALSTGAGLSPPGQETRGPVQSDEARESDEEDGYENAAQRCPVPLEPRLPDQEGDDEEPAREHEPDEIALRADREDESDEKGRPGPGSTRSPSTAGLARHTRTSGPGDTSRGRTGTSQSRPVAVTKERQAAGRRTNPRAVWALRFDCRGWRRSDSTVADGGAGSALEESVASQCAPCPDGSGSVAMPVPQGGTRPFEVEAIRQAAWIAASGRAPGRTCEAR